MKSTDWQPPPRRYRRRRGRRLEGVPIFTTTSSGTALSGLAAGTQPGAGTYYCLGCASHLALNEDERLPRCPRCGGSFFKLDSIFEQLQDHGEPTAEFPAPVDGPTPARLARARSGLAGGTRHLLAYEQDGTLDFEVGSGWNRIGRSAAADIRLDDPSVSRRHALLVAEPGEVLRILDDRSLNGVFVNGEPVEWATLEDGDELAIGRFRLYVLEA